MVVEIREYRRRMRNVMKVGAGEEKTRREREMMGGKGREKETQETQVRCVTSFGV